MEKEIVKNIMGEIPKSSPFHKKSNDYKTTLETRLCSLTLAEKNLSEKVKKILVGDSTSEQKSLFSYNQGISELLFWFLLENKKVHYQIEKRMVAGSNANVDVKFKLDSINFNIEIKSPEYPIKEQGTLVGRIACRVPDQDMKGALKEISDKFRDVIDSTKYHSVNEVYPKDNKIKDCLLSAQKKFPDCSDTNCNILFISTITDELVHYINYLANPFSGFFTEKSYVPHSVFDKINAVILSNAISMNDSEINGGWDLSNALNLIFKNPFCKYQNEIILKGLFDLLPNNTKDYCMELNEFINQQNELNEQESILLFLSNFVYKYGNKK